MMTTLDVTLPDPRMDATSHTRSEGCVPVDLLLSRPLPAVRAKARRADAAVADRRQIKEVQQPDLYVFGEQHIAPSNVAVAVVKFMKSIDVVQEPLDKVEGRVSTARPT